MLSIGEFSKICMCSTKTLRHYDNIGLLHPTRYNGETGYRYYESQQLFDMLLIQKLKNYGFSLHEIKKLLQAKPESLLDSLMKKYAQCTAHIEMQKALLEQIKTDINILKKGENIMKSALVEIKLIRQPNITIVSIRENIAIRDFQSLFAKAYALLEKTGYKCLGAPLAIYHSLEFDPENTDVELAFPTDASGPHTRVLAGGECAVALYRGSYANLSQVYARLIEWLEEESLVMAAPPYEKYLNSPHEVPEDQLLTEVCFPVRKA